MYVSAKTAERIKLLAKSKNIAIKDVLEQCDLNKNALSSMLSRGSWLQANNLAKIADYLGCSVDYLLGRTEEKISPDELELTEEEMRILSAFREMSPERQKALAELLGSEHQK